MHKRVETQFGSIISFFSESHSVFSDEKTLEVVFDGYLFNHGQLAEELNKTGCPDTVFTDGEIMLHLYKKYGKNCLQKAKGMYAFAVHDLTAGTLFLARDRAGGKPLYYARTKDAFVFGPDLKGMLRENVVERQIHKTALAQYLMLSYIPAPLTILENVYKLPAGHYLTVSSGGEMAVEEYWDVIYDDRQKITDYDECKSALRESLFRAVESCMNTGGSVGALLSGGIDSNIIVGIMSKISDKPVDTFSIGYSNVKDYDESDRAVLSAKFHNSNHHLFCIDYENVRDNIERIIENIDEPYADSSYIPTYTISQIAGTHVKTILTGDAGDELFAGYDKYLIGHYSEVYNRIPGFIRNGIIRPVVNLLPSNRGIVRRATKVIDNCALDVFSQRRNLMCLGVHFDDVIKLLTFDGSRSLDFIKIVYDKYEATATEVDRTLYTDFKIVLEGDMLTKADRTSRLANVTSKAPLLHPDVVELAAKIPVEFKIKGKDRKIILKDAFSDCIPEKIATAKKIGFGVPVSYWFQNEMKEDLLETLDRTVIARQGLLNPDYVDFLVEEHLTGRKNNGGILWALYIFEKWYSRYFET